ncbi:hypothetical protein ACFYQT_39980 [Streptomyces tibetensis]|uniref:Uncharacterized protein n=1 Tax=Streptomyces tibetensis TaxID=2382123 RepID=A0ABW6N8G0_9ACTN
MSTEPNPSPAPPDSLADEQPTEPPLETEPPVIEPEPEPEEEAAPPPPEETLGLAVTVEPSTWYEVTSVCATQTCPNLNTATTEPLVYSNAGTIRMVCGLCGKFRPILSAVKLDPQPEMS